MKIIFGVFFIALALLVLVVAWDAAPPGVELVGMELVGAAIVALVLGVLGADIIMSA